MSLWVAKYRTTFLLHFKNIHEFKVNFYGYLIRMPVHLFIMVAIWMIIFKVTGVTSIAGMEFGQFIVYVVLARIIGLTILGWNLVMHFEHYIVEGNLTQYLIRPINFLGWTFSLIIPEAVVVLLLGIVGYVLLTFILPLLGVVTQFYPSLVYLGLFFVSLLLAIVLCFMFYYFVTQLSFWFGKMWYLMSGVYTLHSLLSGELIPLTIHPLFHAVASFLPFKYMTFSPIFIFLEKYTVQESLVQIGIQIGWIVFFIVIIQFAFRKGLKKFEAFGG